MSNTQAQLEACLRKHRVLTEFKKQLKLFTGNSIKKHIIEVDRMNKSFGIDSDYIAVAFDWRNSKYGVYRWKKVFKDWIENYKLI